MYLLVPAPGAWTAALAYMPASGGGGGGGSGKSAGVAAGGGEVSTATFPYSVWVVVAVAEAVLCPQYAFVELKFAQHCILVVVMVHLEVSLWRHQHMQGVFVLVGEDRNRDSRHFFQNPT